MQQAVAYTSANAVVQGIGWGRAQKRLPIHFREFPNVYFSGDWCDASGSVSDVAFDSAWAAASALGAARQGARRSASAVYQG